MRTKILYLLLFIAIAVSVYLTYERTIVRHDFETIESEPEELEESEELGELVEPEGLEESESSEIELNQNLDPEAP